MEEAVSEQYKKDLREQMIGFTRKKEEEFQKKDMELNKKLQEQEVFFQQKMIAEKKILEQKLEDTDPLTVQHAAREFAKVELADHKYVMVLHDHQANPHVHISVRAESKHGKRLNPRKVDLHRWRETFAEKLRDRGVEAEATRQATRGRSRNYEPLWRIKAREDGRLRTSRPTAKSSPRASATRAEAVEAWMQVGRALAASAEKADRELARSIEAFVQKMPPASPTAVHKVQPQLTPSPETIEVDPRR